MIRVRGKNERIVKMANKTNSKKTQNVTKKSAPVNKEKIESVSKEEVKAAESETAKNVIEDCEAPVVCGIDLADENNKNSDVEIDKDESVNKNSDKNEDENVKEDNAPDLILGVVNTSKLNVREKPDINSAVICIIKTGDELGVDLLESTDDFLKVYTVSGIEGYCMRKFINIS